MTTGLGINETTLRRSLAYPDAHQERRAKASGSVAKQLALHVLKPLTSYTKDNKPRLDAKLLSGGTGRAQYGATIDAAAVAERLRAEAVDEVLAKWIVQMVKATNQVVLYEARARKRQAIREKQKRQAAAAAAAARGVNLFDGEGEVLSLYVCSNLSTSMIRCLETCEETADRCLSQR